MSFKKINFKEKFSKFSEHWQPKVVANLNDYEIKHNVLNAKPKNAKSEAETISQAGRLNSITIATNMAGRGADIPLGGDPKILAVNYLQKLC